MHKTVKLRVGLFLFCFGLLIGCNSDKDVTTLTGTLCACAQPIVKWKEELNFHPEKLRDGNAVRKEVGECLEEAKKKYANKAGDQEFREAVTKKVQADCPAVYSSMPALLEMLFGKR